ncbi:hypothetical protein L6452_38329 [Arctium lappa]|uniref:Uncharacterized protein n=1 Tax=Arctium lappa TaxID=4217 RepID=A0ACB8Y5F6_ARCLA|nr:hypothetical protein L6452_38329 [Arctium lappa]
MAKSMRSKKEKRLRAIRREMVQLLYEKKDEAKFAALEAALNAPRDGSTLFYFFFLLARLEDFASVENLKLICLVYASADAEQKVVEAYREEVEKETEAKQKENTVSHCFHVRFGFF